MKQALSFCIAACLVVPVCTIDYEWKGGASGSWGTSSNWTPDGTPGAGDLAYFPSATEITDDFTVGSGSLTISNGAGTVSFKGVISGDGKLVLQGCGEKRFYRDNTFSGGMQVWGTGYRTDGTLIPWNGGVFGDSGAVRIYSGGALGTKTAVFDRVESKDSADGTLNNLGCRLYIEGDMTITTPIDIGFNRDGKPQIYINANNVTFAETIYNVGKRNTIQFSPAGGTVTISKTFTVPGYFTVNSGTAWLEDGYDVGSLCCDESAVYHLPKLGTVKYQWGLYGRAVCEAADVLDFAHAVNSLNFYSKSTLDLNGHRQSIKKVSLPLNVRAGAVLTSPMLRPALLAFEGLSAGERNLTAGFSLTGAAGICWAPANSDATLTLTAAQNPTVGELIVSNGTVQLTGAAFPALSKVTVCAGAKLALDDTALAAFSPKRLLVDSQGQVELGSTTAGTGELVWVTIVDHDTGMESDLPCGVTYGANGTSGATGIPQLSGPGVVAVSQAAKAVWRTATDGAWSTAANWLYGQMPSPNLPVEITAAGGDYTVTAGDVSVTNLTVFNNGGGTATLALNGVFALENAYLDFGPGSGLSVPEGSRMTYDGSGLSVARDAKVSTVIDGAEWNIAGEVVFTNIAGKLSFGGENSHTSRVNVTGNGVLALHSAQEGNSARGLGYVEMLDNFVLDVSGNGVLRRDVTPQKEFFVWLQQGGTMTFRDHATYDVAAVWENCFGSGVTCFKDDAQLLSNPAGAYARVYIHTPVEGRTTEVRFEDRAAYKATTGTFTEIKPTYGRHAIVRFDSEAKHELGYLLVGRNNAGYTDIYITRGHVNVGSSSGMILAGGANIYANYHSCATGTLHMSGGILTVNGASGANAPNYYGIVVGDGNASEGPIEAYGRIELSGGAITNSDSRGQIVLGTGRGRGEFVQTGGDWYANISNSRAFAIIGAQNGEGLYALSNGTACICNRLWVGGATTNDLQRYFLEDRSALVSAKGQLTVAAADLTKPCSLAVDGKMVFGALGTGVLDIGPGGVVTGTDLTLSNRTASVFHARVTDAGTGRVSLSGRFTVAPGAKLEIDATGLSRTGKGRFPLVRCASREGDFAPADVTVEYDGAYKAEVRNSASGIDFVVMRGTALIWR